MQNIQNNVTGQDHGIENDGYDPQQKLQEVEDLTNDLKRLLVQHEIVLGEEGIRHEVEVLERWMESYRRGLSAANKISEIGIEWLHNVRDHLKLAAEERERLESEGGNPLNKEQAKKTEQLHEAVRRIDKAIPDIEQMFVPVEDPISSSHH